VLRGTYPAKIDDKGRLKIPNAFRAFVEDQYGAGLFLTSVTGESVHIYPLPVWLGVEERLGKMPTTHPSRIKFLERVAYFGQHCEFDSQGRVSIQPRLRDSAAMTGEVDVLGKLDHLEVWNHDRLQGRFEGDPFNGDDAKALAEYGI